MVKRDYQMKFKPVLCLLGVLALSSILHAHDTSGIAFVLLFWPAALIYTLLLVILAIVNGMRVRQRFHNQGSIILSVLTLIIAVVGMITFPDILRDFRYRGMAALALVPVEIVGAVASGISLWLLARCIFRKKSDADS
ncbi:MAG: hypothetical protein QG657_329 [Acidobacteriota bacterium]|nr:hypothetical protein [Acidobacteriota bacterium]